MEQVTLGRLTFERGRDEEGLDYVTVRKEGDEEGYATYQLCTGDIKEWIYLKKNCWPVNGKGERPPAGKWVLFEYVGKDGASENLLPADKAEGGFTERELMQLLVIVNAAFAETSDEPILVVEKRRRRKRFPTRRAFRDEELG